MAAATELNERERRLLGEIGGGRARVRRLIADREALRTLEEKGLVTSAKGRPRVPRSGADFNQLFRRGLTSGVVRDDEARLTAEGRRAYLELPRL